MTNVSVPLETLEAWAEAAYMAGANALAGAIWDEVAVGQWEAEQPQPPAVSHRVLTFIAPASGWGHPTLGCNPQQFFGDHMAPYCAIAFGRL